MTLKNSLSNKSSTIEGAIYGDTIYLRRLTLNDANEVYYRWMNDPQTIQYLEARHVSRTMDAIKEYVKNTLANPLEHFFAIFLKDTNRHVGNIKLGPVNEAHRFAHIGLVIGEKDCWGKGIATEAIRLITHYGFNDLKLHKIMAGCYAPNMASKKAFEKAGFQQEGLERSKWRLNNDEYVDGILMGITNEADQ